jgi:hypothetical protein
MEQPVFIHVGFCNTGTTSLQQNFFAARPDVFFVGEPYGERGGIFTAIKSVEDFNFDAPRIAARCKDLIEAKSSRRTIVISDETLCEPPQLYVSRYVMPRDTIALRLRQFFPSAKIIFTIRNQRDYITSMYLNIKRNSARFDCMSVPSFSHWLEKHLTQDRSYFLQNLNFMETIRVYEDIFGHDNICVLPLELLIEDGAERYLEKLCDFMGLPLGERDIHNYARIHNRRMSLQEELAAELVVDDRFARLFGELAESIGRTQLDAALDKGPRASVDLPPAAEEKIRHRVEIGNWLLARDFGLDLRRWGYQIADEQLRPQQLELAEAECRYQTDMDRLRSGQKSPEEFEIRRATEVAALRSRLYHLTAELETVSRSPVWRTVRRVDGALRFMSHATAVILGLF